MIIMMDVKCEAQRRSRFPRNAPCLAVSLLCCPPGGVGSCLTFLSRMEREDSCSAIDPYANALTEALDAFLDDASVLPFLKQSASVLEKVASEQDVLQSHVVDFVFPTSLPSSLYLRVD